MKKLKSVAHIVRSENLEFLKKCKPEQFDLVYIDPPFNTGKKQKRKSKQDELFYEDSFETFQNYMYQRFVETKRILQPHGSFFVHLDYRESHYCKILLDRIFGRKSFMNEIIWAYDYGGRSKKKWPSKHDSIFWYAKDPDHYTFNYDAIDRIPYMAPGLVGKEKAARGKTPTDVWWQTIVPTNSAEKTGYPTQKPIAILERIVKVHSNPGDALLDYFAGSGTFGEAAMKHDRHVALVDNNKQAYDIMFKRLSSFGIFDD